MSAPRLVAASAPGVGAIGVLLLVGHGTRGVLERAIGAPLTSGRLRHGRLQDARGPVEDVLCCWRSAEDSPSGIEWAEVDTHGSPLALARARAALIAAGALDGSSEDEATFAGAPLAVRDALQQHAQDLLPGVRTARAAGVLVDQALGALSRELQTIIGLGDLHRAVVAVRALSCRAATGIALVCPPRVALVGPVNAGKSTVFNRLVGGDRALVHETPGTTRDPVEEEIAIAGVAFLLTDTAGLREHPGHAAEQQGITEARDAARTADLVLLLGDPADRISWQAARDAVMRERGARPVLAVWNKMDLPGADSLCRATAHDDPALKRCFCSARTGSGLAELRQAMLTELGIMGDPWPSGTPAPFLTEHAQAVAEALVRAESGHADYADPLRRLLQGSGRTRHERSLPWRAPKATERPSSL